jgi:hypothetical protein
MQYQIPGAKSPIDGPLIDTSWQPPPQAQPSQAHYAAQQAPRYQNHVQPQILLTTVGSDTAYFGPPQTQPEQQGYARTTQLRYQAPHLWEQPGSSYEPILFPPQPSQAHYQLLQAFRYLNRAFPEPHAGFITDVLWLAPLVTPPPILSYLPQQAPRYQNRTSPEIHMGATPADTAFQVPAQAQPLPAYALWLQAPRYANKALNPNLFDPRIDTWVAPPQAKPELLRYAQLHANRYLNTQAIDQQGIERFGPCLQLIAFSWTADSTPGVTDYKVELGSATGLADRYNIDVGSLDTTLQAYILGGFYFWRVRSYSSGVPTGVSAEQTLTVTCDTFLQPALPAQPEQLGYARLQALRYQNRQPFDVTPLFSVEIPDILGAPTFPDQRWFLRRVIPLPQVPILGAAGQVQEPIPPQAQPSLSQYFQLVQQAQRYQNRALQPIQGPVTLDTSPIPGLAPPPPLQWWALGQAGRYRSFAILVPGGVEAAPTVVIVTTLASVDLPEVMADIIALLGDNS